VILFENLKIGFWKLLVIWDLIFVISNSAKKLVLECFYRVWQKITCQLLIHPARVASGLGKLGRRTDRSSGETLGKQNQYRNDAP